MLQSQLLRAFWRSLETSELCPKAWRSCNCQVLIIKWRFWFMRIYQINLNKHIFNIKTHFYWPPPSKILWKSLTFQSNTWFFVDTKTKNLICMHVMLLQISQYLWKSRGIFVFFYQIDEVRNILIAEFESE